MSRPLELHVTCPDKDTALALGRAAVLARVAACANIAGPVTSVFHWQGKIESGEEWALSCKTQADCLDELVALIRLRHPYDLPVITWAAVGMEPDAAAWLRDETGA